VKYSFVIVIMCLDT